MKDVHEILKMMTDSETVASKLILEAHDIISENKTDAKNVVTTYDRQVQDVLMERFSEACPGAHFFCEEMDHPDSLNAEQVFIIDPIDGTMNFVKGFHHSCISAAYAENGQMIAGAVFNPYFNEMFTAIKGEGAWLNGKRLRVNDCSLAESIACIGSSPYYPELHGRTVKMIDELLLRCLDIRREASAALDLCSVAAGKAGIFAEHRLSIWDYAAAQVVAEEAGCVFCRLNGEKVSFFSAKSDVLCGTPKAVKEFLEAGID